MLKNAAQGVSHPPLLLSMATINAYEEYYIVHE